MHIHEVDKSFAIWGIYLQILLQFLDSRFLKCVCSEYI